MKYVVDKNAIGSEELFNFLKDGNDVIIIDEIILESFKHIDPLKSLKITFNCLTQYVNNVWFTYTNSELINNEMQNGIPSNIDDIISKELTMYLRNLIKNPEYLEKEFASFKKIVTKMLDFHHEFAETDIRQAALIASECIKKSEVQNYKKNREQQLKDIREIALELTIRIFNENHKTNKNIELFHNNISAIYAQLFIHLWRVTDWGVKDGFLNAKNLENDSYDFGYVFISCFVDGLFTKEKWMQLCRADLIDTFKIIHKDI